MRPVTVRTALCSVVLALCAAGPVATPAHGSAAAAADQPELRIGSYNIRAGVPLSAFKDAVSAFKPNADVAGLQEIGANDRNKFLKADHDWGYFRPPQLQQNPVIWRRDLFDFVGAEGFRIAKERDLHGEHSGDEAKGDSWATVVRLVHRASGEQISFINVHLVRGAVKGGRPAPDKPHLFELYTDQVDGTVEAIEQERGKSDRVYVLGDFNVGFEADAKRRNKNLPYKEFGALGLRSMWQGSPLLAKPYGTHNDALIDQVWSTEDSSAERILRTIKQSDHSPTVATYVLPAPDPGYQPAEGTMGFGDVRLIANGNQPGDTENNGPSKLPSMFVAVDGDLRYGYAEVVIDGGTAERGLDFYLDDSQLHDNDPATNEIAIDIIGDEVSEETETFTLRLVDPVNTKVAPNADEITLTIHDND